MLIISNFLNLNISFKKLNFFLLRMNGLSLKNTLIYLNFNFTKISLILKKAFLYSIYNAKNNFNTCIDNLRIFEISSGKGRCLKRLLLKSKGRANFYFKFYSNLKLILKS